MIMSGNCGAEINLANDSVKINDSNCTDAKVSSSNDKGND